MTAGPVEVPPWLRAAFPARRWGSLRACALNVSEDCGAGLDLESTDFGYSVDAVDEEPGQDPCLKPSDAVIAIGGAPLAGLTEDDLRLAFGQRLRQAASVLLLSSAELAAAAAELPEPSDVCQIALACGAGVSERLQSDLATFADKTGVHAELLPSVGTCPARVVLAGARGKVCCARPELGALLSYHGVAAGQGKQEVSGMALQSLPARNRRKRCAPDGPLDQVGAPADGAGRPGDGEAASGDGNPLKAQRVKAECQACDLTGVAELEQYEYMDHTADVIIHSWGKSLKEAMGQVCVCFYSYMTDLAKVDVNTSFEVEATGHDMLDMLYHLLDELLFNFGTEFVICRHVEILSIDDEQCKVRARGYGEKWDREKHPQGTEIKAITMHQMKILTPTTLTSEEGVVARTSDGKEGGTEREGFPYECYVLVDI